MEKILSLHQKEYVTEPEVIAEAPGVFTIMGNHTENEEGIIIQAALDMKVQAAVSRRKDNSIRFYAADFSERKRTSAANIKYKREDRWANFIKGVIFAMEGTGHVFKGLDITLTGNIPQGIGLSSSVAIEAASAMALAAMFEISFEKEDFIKAVFNAEEKFIGSSRQPAAAYSSFYGKRNRLLSVDLRNRSVEYIQAPASDTGLILTVSNVPQIPVDKEILERRKDAAGCVEKLNIFKTGTSLRDYSSADIRHGMGVIPEHVRRRCIHVVEEIIRTEEAKTAFLRNDMITAGKLMNRSHESLRDNFEVSCPEIDWLVKRAQEIEGVYGSKITGTGFGGCTITLINNKALEKYQEKLEEYERIFGFRADMIKCSISDGAKLVYPVK